MPDRNDWTAAMVLEWVLTRDMSAVVAIAADRGVKAVDLVAGTVTEIQPASMQDVARRFAIDESIVEGEEKIAEAFVREELKILPALSEIYDALKDGQLEARARRNGRGDLVVIESDQWLVLKIISLEGHDLAVPVDLNQKRLPLPKSLDDYLVACVPVDATPSVWPDPLFRADQVTKHWPAARQNPAQPDLAPSQHQANRSTSGAQTKCEIWLRATGADELAKEPKSNWQSKAKAQFAGLSDRGFLRAWGNVAAEFPKISKAGAKPKQNN